MRNALKILRRDLLRWIKAPTAWVIAFGLCFIPPMYAWFNVRGFWNPYNNTNGIKVAVANKDKGTTSTLTGDLNAGKQVVAELKKNKQIGWTFMNESDALESVESERCYAAIIIPSDFSDSLVNVVTGSGDRPRLSYYVNEKANSVATKVTDTGANTLDQQINSNFVSTASKAIVNIVNKTADTIDDQASAAGGSAAKDLRTTSNNLATIRQTMTDLDTTLAQVPTKTAAARASLNTATQLVAQAGNGLAGTSQLLKTAQTSINTFTSESSTALDTSSSLLSQASSQTSLTVAALGTALTKANGSVQTALDAAQNVSDTNATIITELTELNTELGNAGIATDAGTAALKRLQQQNDNLQGSISDLNNLNRDINDTVTAGTTASQSLNDATQNTLQSTDKARNTINTKALPKLNSGLSSLASTSATLNALVTGQDSLVAQVNTVLDQLDQSAASTRSAISSAGDSLDRVQSKVDTLATDLTALSTSNALSNILGENGKLDAKKISDFMLSPTVLSTKTLFPVNSYGSAMAPLFTALSLWVGAFALTVILRTEADDDGIENITPGERYWGRWLLLAILAAGQGVTTTVGEMLLGVQAVNPFAFVGTGIIVALVYHSIIYALATTFLHIGKGIAIALVMVQIPGGTGLYPIEMMPSFFRKVYQLFPFTYAIGALRECIAGFYDGQWLDDIAKLMIFAVAFFILGLWLRPKTANLNRLFTRELEEGDMVISEKMEMPGRTYGLTQIIRALAGRDEYRERIERRAARFTMLYPKLKRAALITGIAVPVILAVVLSILTPSSKVNAMVIWLIWILLIMGFLMTIELIKDNIERQTRLGNLDEEAIQQILLDEQDSRPSRIGRHSA